jgi:hypothetical protein
MNTNTNPDNHRPHHNHQRPRQENRLNRSAVEVMQHLPMGWTATVTEPDAEGTKDRRTRLRVMVLEHPDKGFRLLMFLTIRIPKRMQTDAGEVEVIDDMDILPQNIVEAALPADLFNHGKVLEELCVKLDDYAKKQAALPPPSKKPLTQRPFAHKLSAEVSRGRQEQRRQQVHEQEQQFQPNQRKKNRRGRQGDHRSLLALAIG